MDDKIRKFSKVFCIYLPCLILVQTFDTNITVKEKKEFGFNHFSVKDYCEKKYTFW